MTWSHSKDRLVCFSNLSLKLVNLLQVLCKAAIVAFLLHRKHRSKVSPIAPLLPLAGYHYDGSCKAVFVERTYAPTEFVAETGRKRIKSVLFV